MRVQSTEERKVHFHHPQKWRMSFQFFFMNHSRIREVNKEEKEFFAAIDLEAVNVPEKVEK